MKLWFGTWTVSTLVSTKPKRLQHLNIAQMQHMKQQQKTSNHTTWFKARKSISYFVYTIVYHKNNHVYIYVKKLIQDRPIDLCTYKYIYIYVSKYHFSHQRKSRSCWPLWRSLRCDRSLKAFNCFLRPWISESATVAMHETKLTLGGLSPQTTI